MSDLISRADALEAIKWMPVDTDAKTVQRCIEAVSNLPSAQPEQFEWCTDCKEYDQERHCCHRWTKVIRKTVDEIKADHVRHGRWIKEFENEDGRNLRCSECRMVFNVGKGRDGNYCPNCGCRMDEE